MRREGAVPLSWPSACHSPSPLPVLLPRRTAVSVRGPFVRHYPQRNGVGPVFRWLAERELPGTENETLAGADVPGPGAAAQPFGLSAPGQPPGEPPPGFRVPQVRPDALHLDVALLGQPPGQQIRDPGALRVPALRRWAGRAFAARSPPAPRSAARAVRGPCPGRR